MNVKLFLILCLAWIHSPAMGEESRLNVLLICVDDLRPELGCFGKDYIDSPNIDALAETGLCFRRHYVQAPTCGASRFALLTGKYGPGDNNAIFARANAMQKQDAQVSPSMPTWFRNHGYTTVSVGKVSHHPGGRGGPDWNDDSQPEMPDAWDRHLLPAGDWQHPRGAMHGLAHGEIRSEANAMDLFQSIEGEDSIYPDGLIVDESLRQLNELATADRPFFLAVGIIRPHLPFGAPKKYMLPYVNAKLPPIPHPAKPLGKTTWHNSGEFMKYNRWGRDPNEDAEFATQVRKHYAACVSYADAQVGRVLQKMKELGVHDKTVVVLWGDHGWHLGEHAVWGKHTLFEESLRSPLIIHYPGLESAGQSTEAMVETIDIFPTVCEIAKVPLPNFVDGVSLKPILQSPDSDGHEAISYFKKARTIRDQRYRLIVHDDGTKELYDHTSSDPETNNIAQSHAKEVQRLMARLDARHTK